MPAASCSERAGNLVSGGHSYILILPSRWHWDVKSTPPSPSAAWYMCLLISSAPPVPTSFIFSSFVLFPMPQSLHLIPFRLLGGSRGRCPKGSPVGNRAATGLVRGRIRSRTRRGRRSRMAPKTSRRGFGRPRGGVRPASPARFCQVDHSRLKVLDQHQRPEAPAVSSAARAV